MQNNKKMADITKCNGEGCSIKDSCYRFTVKANEYYQSYFVEPPINNGKCEMYWGENTQFIQDTLKNIRNEK